MAWRLLNLGVVDPYEGQSLLEALLIAHERGLIPNTICFFVPKRHVQVGRGASLSQLVNVEYCEREGIPIVRYMMAVGGNSFDEDCLEFVSISEENHDAPFNRELLLNCILKGLQLLGLNVVIRGKSNDILSNGKKVSGCGVERTHGRVIFGADVLVGFNHDFCEKALILPPSVFVNKEAKNIREWMTSLKTQLRREVEFDEVVFALKGGFESVLQVKFEVSNSLTEAEGRILGSLQEKYHSEEWLRSGRWSPVKDYGR